MIPYHDWSETGFDWKGLNDAGVFIAKYCYRYARLGIWWKEKYGTLRVSPQWGNSIHNIIWPGYCFNQFKYKWMWRFDMYLCYNTWCKYVFNLVYMWQKFILKRAYILAIKKWPHIDREILDDYWFIFNLEGKL